MGPQADRGGPSKRRPPPTVGIWGRASARGEGTTQVVSV
jgi:hypothetical protein